MTAGGGIGYINWTRERFTVRKLKLFRPLIRNLLSQPILVLCPFRLLLLHLRVLSKTKCLLSLLKPTTKSFPLWDKERSSEDAASSTDPNYVE
jgi:hypothetical protein